MRCFEELQKVLDEAYHEIEAVDDAARDELIMAELARLRAGYADLLKPRVVDYSEPVTRFAYVYCYVSSHANLVYQIIRQSRTLRELFEGDNVRAACIGGGPGSDLLGMLKYLDRTKHPMTLTASLYDKETAWGETWANLFEQVTIGDTRLLPHFNSFDVTEPSSWRKFKRCLSSDIFTMIYFMSEVYRLRDKAEEYFDFLMSGAKPGALFLFVDNGMANGSPLFSNWFDEVAERNGVITLKQGNNERFLVGPDEDKDALGVYYTKFSPPKLQAYISWRVAQKPI
jgi:hypothetical protein